MRELSHEKRKLSKRWVIHRLRLIDEISLVISPCFVGNKEKQLFDNLLLSEKVNLELQGTENAEHGCLSLRYAVKNKD